MNIHEKQASSHRSCLSLKFPLTSGKSNLPTLVCSLRAADYLFEPKHKDTYAGNCRYEQIAAQRSSFGEAFRSSKRNDLVSGCLCRR